MPQIRDLIDPENPPKCAWCKQTLDLKAIQDGKEKLVVHYNGMFIDEYYHMKCSEEKDRLGVET